MKKTAFDLMHVPGFNPPAGHNKWGYTNGGDRVAMAKGGWIQDVNKSIKKRGTKESVHLLQKKVALEEQKR